jgi:hypothetical protein
VQLGAGQLREARHAASGPPRGLRSMSILLPICVVMDDAAI